MYRDLFIRDPYGAMDFNRPLSNCMFESTRIPPFTTDVNLLQLRVVLQRSKRLARLKGAQSHHPLITYRSGTVLKRSTTLAYLMDSRTQQARDMPRTWTGLQTSTTLARGMHIDIRTHWI